MTSMISDVFMYGVKGYASWLPLRDLLHLGRLGLFSTREVVSVAAVTAHIMGLII